MVFIVATGSAPEWCCSVVKDYPDFVPHVTWGSVNDQSVKDKWNADNCNTLVGGSSKSNCEGI